MARLGILASWAFAAVAVAGCSSGNKGGGALLPTGGPYPSIERSTLSVDRTSALADGVDQVVVTVVVLDSEGAPIEGRAVTVTASGSGNVLLTLNGGVTDSTGVVTARLASTTAETKRISGTVSGEVTLAQTQVTFAAPVLAFLPLQDVLLRSPFTVQVAVRDLAGGTVTTARDDVTVSIASGPAGATLGGTTTATAVNGVATLTVSLDRLGSYSLAASAPGRARTWSAALGVFPALGLCFPPATPVAGVPTTFDVQVLDGLGGLVSDYAGTISLSSNDPRTLRPQSVTLGPADGGQRTNLPVTFFSSLSRLSATDGVVSTYRVLTVTPGPPSRLTVEGLERAVRPGQPVTVWVTARDAFGNRTPTYTGTVTLRAPGDGAASLPAPYAFTPADAGRRAFTVVFREGTLGMPLRATDGTSSPGSAAVWLEGRAHPFADVTGDGTPDVVGIVGRAAPLSPASALAVFAGGSSSPTATLVEWTTALPAFDWLTDVPAEAPPHLALADVSGDGVADVVAWSPSVDDPVADAGALLVWRGGAGLSGGGLAPSAVLRAPAPVAGDGLTSVPGLVRRDRVCVADVTGDGVADVVAGAPELGANDAGAVLVWVGGAALAGTPAPGATLAVPAAAPGDRLAGGFLRLADLSGDGVLDVVAGTPDADVGGTADAGAIYLWRGGAAFSAGPDATLTLGAPAAGDALGGALLVGQEEVGPTLDDLDGDGILDLVATSAADVGGVADTGALHVWYGGPALAGARTSDADLVVAGAAAGDALATGPGLSVVAGDVTGDGALDMVASATQADVAGTADAGAVYVWRGGARFAGAVSQQATLRVPVATAGERLAAAQGSDPWSLALVDVTGDGTLDVVAAASLADVAGVADAGAVHLWAGGPGMTGTIAPSRTLRSATPSPSDQLGSAGLRLADVTGDGLLDVVAGASLADVGGVANAGAAYVWRGGPLSGVAPTAVLTVSGLAAGDALAAAALHLGDVTGDGVLDVLAGARDFDANGVTDSGATFVWAGGLDLAGAPQPTVTLVGPGVSGHVYAISVVCDTLLADVTGDGVLDVVEPRPAVDRPGAADTGAIFVWHGGGQLAGAPSPSATLTDPAASGFAGLGFGGTAGALFADVTGDGVTDLLGQAVFSVADGSSGAIHLWTGGAGLAGAPAALVTFRTSGDGLGQ